MSSLDERVDALFSDLPADPQERLAAVARLYAAIRERAAKHLEPAVREMVRDAVPLNRAEKLEVCQTINRVLEDAGLGVLDPNTKVPAGLAPQQSRPNSHISRIYLRDRTNGPDGKRHVLHLKPQLVAAIQLVPARTDAAEHPPEEQIPGRWR